MLGLISSLCFRFMSILKAPPLNIQDSVCYIFRGKGGWLSGESLNFGGEICLVKRTGTYGLFFSQKSEERKFELAFNNDKVNW